MSTPTATILPAVCGCTSVCTSAARLPVASKKRGSCREIAAVVETSITAAVGLAAAMLLFWPFERPQAMKLAPAAVASKTISVSLIHGREVICSISFSWSFLLLVSQRTIAPLSLAHATQQNVGELARRHLIRNLQQGPLS